jgi:SAM-dependent methyltransferase
VDHALEITAFDEMELAPTLEAAEPLFRARVLELGAGTGRLTIRMAERGASIIAVDFSERSLESLAQRIQPGWEVGLVYADCTQLEVESNSFELVVSTLVSNLPSAQHRARMMAVAANACKPSGTFVFGTHYYGFRSRLRGERQSGRYPGSSIYRYLFRSAEIKAETRPFFDDIRSHPMVISIPFAARAGLPIIKLSRLFEHVPVINNFGELLLVIARRPIESVRG